MKKALLFLLLALAGCTTKYPVTVGTLGGAAVGTGVGALVGKTSDSISVARGMTVGAIAGVPAGIMLAYASDSAAKHYIISTNDALIDANNERIYENEQLLDGLRSDISFESPRGMPDEDSFQYLYVGPRLGNHWR